MFANCLFHNNFKTLVKQITILCYSGNLLQFSVTLATYKAVDMYVDAFAKCFKQCKYIMYADDTTIYFGSDNPKLLHTTIQNGLSEASEWLTENCLVVNASKSEFIILGNNSRMEYYNPCFEMKVKVFYANDTHLYSTRYASNNNLHVPKPHTNYMKCSISYRGVTC